MDAAELVHADLAAGAHMITSRGVDTDDQGTRPYRPTSPSLCGGTRLAVVGGGFIASAE